MKARMIVLGVLALPVATLIYVFMARQSPPASAPLPPAAQGPGQPQKTFEELSREAVVLNLPQPPPLTAPPEDLKAYFALLDKLAPGNAQAARAAVEARRIYREAERKVKQEERKAKTEKERAETKAEREAYKAKKDAEHPPRDPRAVPGPPLFPPPVLGPGTTGVEKPELPKPAPK